MYAQLGTERSSKSSFNLITFNLDGSIGYKYMHVSFWVYFSILIEGDGCQGVILSANVFKSDASRYVSSFAKVAFLSMERASVKAGNVVAPYPDG